MTSKAPLIISLFLVLVSLTAIGVSLYTYNQYKTVSNNPQPYMDKESQSIIKRLGAFMDLPTEKPTVVSVVDREKLQEQEFFNKAQNGDKVIIYEKARRVILYRPSTGKVIDVAPLVVDTQMPKGSALEPIPETIIDLPIQQASPSAGAVKESSGSSKKRPPAAVEE